MAVLLYLGRALLCCVGRVAHCRCDGDRVLVAGSTQEALMARAGVRPHPPHALLPQRRKCAALLAAPRLNKHSLLLLRFCHESPAPKFGATPAPQHCNAACMSRDQAHGENTRCPPSGRAKGKGSHAV